MKDGGVVYSNDRIKTRTHFVPTQRIELFVRWKEDIQLAPYMRGSGDVFVSYHERMNELDRENFVVICLDNKHKVVADHLVGVGTLTSCLVHPREVLKALVLTNSAACILLHNHPSGDPLPSKEDLEITRRIREVTELLGIRCLDHVVIGGGRYVSFVEDGYW